MNLYISYSPAIKSRFVIILFMICRYSVVIISVQFSSVAQSYQTLCDPMNRSTPGKYAKKLLWYVCVFSLIWLFATPWTVAHQAPLSMEFSRQEYWSRLPFCTSEDLPNPGIEPVFLASPALAGGFFTTVPPGIQTTNSGRKKQG